MRKRGIPQRGWGRDKTRRKQRRTEWEGGGDEYSTRGGVGEGEKLNWDNSGQRLEYEQYWSGLEGTIYWQILSPILASGQNGCAHVISKGHNLTPTTEE